jgi:hypothetical protein
MVFPHGHQEQKLAGKTNSVYKTGKYEEIDFPEGTPANVQKYFRTRGIAGVSAEQN